jgi:hypothetical protein
MVNVKQKNASTPLNLVYGNNHFELVEIYSKNTNIPIPIHNDDKKKKNNYYSKCEYKKNI